MTFNVIQLVQSALTDDVVRQLSARMGLPADATRRVLATTGPALVAGLMQKGATLDGARSLFATILSPEVNGHIAEQLPQLLGSTGGMSQLEGMGRQLLERGLDRRADALSDEVAVQTGVPAHATHAVAGIVGATLLGVLKRHFLEGQSGVAQLPTLLGQQLPVIAPDLNDRLLGTLGMGGVGAFAGSILSQLKAVASHIDQPVPADKPVAEALASIQVPADAVVRSEPRSRKWLWWLFAALAAVLAFLFLRGCPSERRDDLSAAGASGSTAAAAQTASSVYASAVTAAVTPPAAAASDVAASAVEAGAQSAASDVPGPSVEVAPTRDSQLVFAVSASGKPTLTATVGSEAEKIQLITELTKRLGTYNFEQIITVDPAVKPAGWLAHINGLLPLMTVPGAEVKVDGMRIELSASAADAKLGWLGKLKSVFGDSYRIGAFDAASAVAEANGHFLEAVKGLLAPDDTCEIADVVKALNLQVVNFASASARVPASAAEDLKLSAKVLSACARSGKLAQLEVSGYSDNVGGSQANLQLSKKRAEAVRAYLVKAGAPAGSLVAQGYGDANPLTSNDTESGRFTNRRIEFVVRP
jgi:outer membrane protein OmpA-like peptidoglycan-associated protein